MLKKTCFKIAGILAAFAVLASTVTVILPISAAAPKSPPTDWFTDDFEHGNNLKALYDQSYTNNADVITTEISAESEESDNKVLSFKKTAAATGDVNVTIFPQTADGEYALVGDETQQGIKPASGKTYRYIVEYKYRMVSISGYGIYSEVGVSERDSRNLKNAYTSYHESASPNTTNIGTWGEFQTLCPLGEWQTLSMPATYKPGDGLSVPTVAINFKLAGNFVGEFQIDNICIKRVAEGDTTSTVIFNTNCTSPEQKYNPVTYVTGAEYTLPVPTRRGYEFIGWYSDGNFTELCDNYLPENNVKGKYSRLFARWSNTAMTDDFDQTMISESDRELKGGFSIENGAGINGTAALKLSRSGAGEAFTVPLDLKGKLYTLETEKDKTYNYTAEITYKTSSEEAVSILFDLVENGTEKSVASAQGEIEISDALGNNDGEWHTATVALRFKATDVKTATVAVRAKTVGAAEVIIDNLNLIEINKSFGSYKFVGDEYTGYYAPVAGVKGNRTYISTPDRDGHIFVGWADADGNVINTDAFGDTDYVLYPKWEQTPTPEGTTLWTSDNFDYNADSPSDEPADNPGDNPSQDDPNTFIDDFESRDTLITEARAGLSIQDGKGKNGGKALVFDLANKLGTMNFVPQDADGNRLAINAGESYKFIVTITYRMTEVNNLYAPIWMKHQLVNSGNGWLGAFANNFHFGDNIWPNRVPYSSDLGYYCGPTDDRGWHTVSYPISGTGHSYAQGYLVHYFDGLGNNGEFIIDEIKYTRVDSNAQLSTAKLYSNGGITYDYATAVTGSDITTLPTPTRAGFDFGGWYSDAELTQKCDTVPANDQSQSESGRTTPNVYVNLYAKWIGPFSDGSEKNVSETTGEENMGKGKTKALKVSATEAGAGFFNLTDSETLAAPTKTLGANEKVNWIVRFWYKATALPENGLGIEFDIAKPKSSVSLSVEGGTSNGVSLTAADGKWHMLSMPVALTRSTAAAGEAVTLLVKLKADAAVSGIYFDEFEIFDADDKELSLVKYNGKVYVEPITGVKGTKLTLPKSSDPAYSVGGWYTDEKMTELFGKAGDTITLGDASVTLYGDFLNPYGYYATETFDNTIDIWTNQMTSRGSAFEAVWNQWGGPRGKMLDFRITDEDSYDEDGKSLKYDSDLAKDNWSAILLTDSINDQIYLGSKFDEDPATYIVSFWYKIDRADTDLTLGIGGSNYNCYWEGNSRGSDPIKFTAGTKTDGWQQITLYMQVDWTVGSAGENANDVYAQLSIKGEGVIYFDEINYTKVNSGLAEALYFDTDGGSLCLPVVGRQGDTIPTLPTPVKEGYTFEGWYTDYAYENRFTRTTFGGDGTNYLFANFIKNEDKKPANDAEEETEITDTEDTPISDNNNSGGGDISWEKRPIYEDVTEEFTTTNYRTKTVITKTKISDGSGLSTLWIVLIIVAAVVVLAGATLTVILLVKRKRSRR